MVRTCSALPCEAASASNVACYSPLKAYRTPHGSDNAITFNATRALNSSHPITFPCGQCVGCRSDRVQQWGLRCMHEAQMHPHNSFLTLTYDDEHLPADYSVDKPTFQKFMKRLRKPMLGKLRFYACGEYGDINGRPHYHALIFGWDFHADRKLIKETEFGNLYTSDQASKAWPFGHVWIGDVSYKSAAYVAGYVSKKITGPNAPSHYLRTHPKGYLVQVKSEFQLSSVGIGRAWYQAYKFDAFPSDFLVVDGKQVPVPRYYLDKLKAEGIQVTRHLPAYDLTITSTLDKEVKKARIGRAIRTRSNNTPERLRVREIIKKDRLSRYKRTL